MKVHFFQDNSFFRTAQGTNPYFDPIIKVCEENGIEWKLFTYEPSIRCGYGPEHVGYWGRLSKLSVWFWRFVHLVWRVEPWKIQVLFGKLVRPFVGRKYDADLFITIAGNMCEQLYGMFPQKRNIDIQHGVIYSRHSGYFDENGRLRAVYQKMKTREFWMYGSGYVDCFFKNRENVKDLEGRVKVIGDVFEHAKVTKHVRNLVVVSAQFKPECTRECLERQVVLLRNFLTEFYRLFGDQYEVLIKHHPRCAGGEMLSVLYNEFPMFKETKASWPDLYGRMILHVTISSTVVFDAASNGIPTYLIDPPVDEPLLENWFWRDDYGYPYFGKSLADLMCIADREDTHNEMSMWYNHFYTPFTETQCKRLLGVTVS